MLQIIIPKQEGFDAKTNAFIEYKAQTLTMEHSLVSISKWESKWCKPFLGTDDKTEEQIYDYFRCMTLTQNIDSNVYYRLTDDNIKAINNYVDAPMTATVFFEFDTKNKKPNTKKIMTSEEIYYLMISHGIPMECQKWHINRLLTLIRVFNVKNSNQKMSKAEAARAYQKLNAQRRSKMKSKG